MKANSDAESSWRYFSRVFPFAMAALVTAVPLALTGEAAADRSSGVPLSKASLVIDQSQVWARPQPGTEEAVTPRKKKSPRKRSWRMPVRVAEDRADRHAGRFFERTTPGKFDTGDPAVAERVWDDYYTDSCERINRSRVSCSWRVESDWLTVDDENNSDEYLFDSYYACEGELEVWYPRAREKSLKEKASTPECSWEIVDDGSDGEDESDEEDGGNED